MACAVIIEILDQPKHRDNVALFALPAAVKFRAEHCERRIDVPMRLACQALDRRDHSVDVPYRAMPDFGPQLLAGHRVLAEACDDELSPAGERLSEGMDHSDMGLDEQSIDRRDDSRTALRRGHELAVVPVAANRRST